MEFVNINGQPIQVAGGAQQAKKSKRPPESYHKGWRVLGFSPEQIAAGRAAYAADGIEARTGRPFSVDEYMVTHRPKPVQSKPFVVYSAAEVCKRIAERSGWLGVRIEAKSKGAE